MNMVNRRNKGSSLIDKVLTPCNIHLGKLLGTVFLLLYVFPEIGSQYSADVSKGKLMRHKVPFINYLFDIFLFYFKGQVVVFTHLPEYRISDSQLCFMSTIGFKLQELFQI